MAPTESSTRPASAGAPTVMDTPSVADRRYEPRELVACDLWMIDHYGSTVLRCRCHEISPNGMRLCVPLGYGVAEGQRYELRSHLPGARSGTTLGLIGSRWATVVRTRLRIEDGEDHLEVGVVLDNAEAPLRHVIS